MELLEKHTGLKINRKVTYFVNWQSLTKRKRSSNWLTKKTLMRSQPMSFKTRSKRQLSTSLTKIFSFSLITPSRQFWTSFDKGLNRNESIHLWLKCSYLSTLMSFTQSIPNKLWRSITKNECLGIRRIIHIYTSCFIKCRIWLKRRESRRRWLWKVIRDQVRHLL